MSTVGSSTVNYFLKLDGIPGESKDAVHTDEIDILSWSFGANRGRPGYSPESTAPSASVKDITVQKLTDKSTTQLFLYCTSGQPIRTLVITCRKTATSQLEYLVVTCSDVFVTSYALGGSHGDDVQTETVTFGFRRMEMSYRQIQADGTLGGVMKAVWDLMKSQAI